MSLNLTEIAKLHAGYAPEWHQQGGEQITATNGPPGPTDGVVITPAFFTNIRVTPDDNGRIAMRVWIKWEDFETFDILNDSTVEIDGMSWTHRLRTSGVERVYIEVVELEAPGVDIHIGPCKGQ